VRSNDAAMDLLVALYRGQEVDVSLEQLLHPDVTCRDWTIPGRTFRGAEEVWNECFLTGASAFDDATEEIIEVIRDDSRLFIRATFRGVFVGPYRGIAPHGKAVSYEVVDSYEFLDGEIVGMRFGADTLSLGVSLGAIEVADAPW
jgi:predicted ester cyclase